MNTTRENEKKNEIHRMHWDRNNMPIDNDNDCSQCSFGIEINRRDRVHNIFFVAVVACCH